MDTITPQAPDLSSPGLCTCRSSCWLSQRGFRRFGVRSPIWIESCSLLAEFNPANGNVRIAGRNALRHGGFWLHGRVSDGIASIGNLVRDFGRLRVRLECVATDAFRNGGHGHGHAGGSTVAASPGRAALRAGHSPCGSRQGCA